MTDQNPLDGAAAPPPRQRTGFRQGEAYGGAESHGPRSEPLTAETRPGAGPNLRPLFYAGGLMLAATILSRLLGASGWVAFGLGVAVFLGALVWFRGRPARPRRIADADGVDPGLVRDALDAAESDLLEIDRLAHGLLDRGLRGPLGEMTAAAREVLEHIAEDPGDLRRARKYLKVYIPSARAAVAKFAGLGVVDAELSNRFRGLVEEMTATGRRQLETLRLDDKTSLEVEMDVLADRLGAERPTPKN